MLKITSDFDHGNIKVLEAADPSNVRLEIKPDTRADFYQWFYFCVDGAVARPLTMHIENAAGSSYVKGWDEYRAVASYDQERWFRVETKFDGKKLTIRHTPDQDRVYYAYFAAYPTTRYRDFIGKMKSQSCFTHVAPGKTLDGQEMSYFRWGEGKKNFWIIARQHPGEDMGSWWMEGFLPALAEEKSEAAKALSAEATLHIIPCMNLDGAKRGHLRTNAAGVDLNRAWRNSTMEQSPEVFVVRELMRKTGVDFFLDVHGDEAIPNNFLDGAWGIPSWDDRHEMRFTRYAALLLDISKDFQTKDGYARPKPGGANLDIATNYVAETWGCLAMTLEMPFKDANVNPDPVYGWSPDRCRNFAREHLEAMAEIAPILP